MFWHVVFCALIALAALQLVVEVMKFWRDLSRPPAGEERSLLGRYAVLTKRFSCCCAEKEALLGAVREEGSPIGVDDAEVYEALRALKVRVKEGLDAATPVFGKSPDKLLFVVGKGAEGLLHSAYCSVVQDAVKELAAELIEVGEDDKEGAECGGEPDVCFVAFCELDEAVWKFVCRKRKEKYGYDGDGPFYVLREQEFDELLEVPKDVHAGSVAGA